MEGRWGQAPIFLVGRFGPSTSTILAMSAVSIGEIVDLVGGEFAGAGGTPITSVAPLASANSAQLSFLSNPKYSAELAATKAGAILVPKKMEGNDPRWIHVDDPYFAFARVMERWFSTGRSRKAFHRRRDRPQARLGRERVARPFRRDRR